MSVACVCIFITFFAVRAKSLLSGQSALMFFTEVPIHDYAIDLIDRGFFFKISSLSASIGTVKMEEVKWESSSKLSIKQIPLVDCSDNDAFDERSIALKSKLDTPKH